MHRTTGSGEGCSGSASAAAWALTAAAMGAEGHTLHWKAPPVAYVLSAQGRGAGDPMGQ